MAVGAAVALDADGAHVGEQHDGALPDLVVEAGFGQLGAGDGVGLTQDIEAVSGDLSAVAEMRTVYDRRRRKIVSMLSDIPGIVCPEPLGAFYAYPSVKGLLNVSLRGKTAENSTELAAIILDEAEVAVVPGEAFGTPGYLRMSYALGDDDLAEGVGRIAKLVAEG